MGIMVCYAEPVAGNYGVNDVPVGMIHGELCYASGHFFWQENIFCFELLYKKLVL